MSLRDYSLQLKQLLSEIASFEAGNITRFCIVDLINGYNTLITQFNREFNRDTHPFASPNMSLIYQGIIYPDDLRLFKLNIESMKEEIDSLIQEEKNNFYRFRCFKIGHQCPHEINPQRFLFFVGMPFAPEYSDSYQYGIKDMLARHGIEVERRIFKADEQPSTIDILCKICKGIQESQNIIINISDQNPNVMFELGLAYGLNKNVFLIKDKDSAVISDLNGLEYTSYSNAEELASKLETRFREQGIF